MKVFVLEGNFYVFPLMLPFLLAVTSFAWYLTENNFSFNDNRYLQIQGTAMGTKMAPDANLFLGCFEANALGSLEHAPEF